MPLISDSREAAVIYDRAAKSGLCVANFATANRRTTEAILRAVHEYQLARGRSDLPVVISVTANYPPQPQLRQYTASDSALVGLAAFLSDIDVFLNADSPYRDVRVMLHLDHAWPGYDDEIIARVVDPFASVMYDCSMYPLEENMHRVAAFVRAQDERVLVEAAVDELKEAAEGGADMPLTDPVVAQRFVEETGEALIVPNVGTEHRSTAAGARYHGDVAAAIARSVGPRLVLHGASSLSDDDLGRLAGDGFVKINIWSALERVGSQAVIGDVVRNLDRMVPATSLAAWVKEGWLGQAYESRETAGPRMEKLTELHRRQVWQTAVVERLSFYLQRLGYDRWR